MSEEDEGERDDSEDVEPKPGSEEDVELSPSALLAIFLTCSLTTSSMPGTLYKGYCKSLSRIESSVGLFKAAATDDEEVVAGSELLTSLAGINLESAPWVLWHEWCKGMLPLSVTKPTQVTTNTKARVRNMAVLWD